MKKYIVKINGRYFAGVNEKFVYPESYAQQPFRCLINICAKPDGMPVFDFSESRAYAKRMDFFEVCHNFMQMLNVRVRYHYLPPVEIMEIEEIKEDKEFKEDKER